MTSEQIFKQWQVSTRKLKSLHIKINANRDNYHALWNEFDALHITKTLDAESIRRIQGTMEELQAEYWELSEQHVTLMEAHEGFYQQHQASVAQELERITGRN